MRCERKLVRTVSAPPFFLFFPVVTLSVGRANIDAHLFSLCLSQAEEITQQWHVFVPPLPGKSRRNFEAPWPGGPTKLASSRKGETFPLKSRWEQLRKMSNLQKHTHVHEHTYIHIHAQAYTHIQSYANTYADIQTTCTYMHTHVRAHTWMYKHR